MPSQGIWSDLQSKITAAPMGPLMFLAWGNYAREDSSGVLGSAEVGLSLNLVTNNWSIL